MVAIAGDPLIGLKRAHCTFIISQSLSPCSRLDLCEHVRHRNIQVAPRVFKRGLDVLESQKFAPLRGKHVGLITNHTGLDSQGRSTVDVLSHASAFN